MYIFIYTHIVDVSWYIIIIHYIHIYTHIITDDAQLGSIRHVYFYRMIRTYITYVEWSGISWAAGIFEPSPAYATGLKNYHLERQSQIACGMARHPRPSGFQLGSGPLHLPHCPHVGVQWLLSLLQLQRRHDYVNFLQSWIWSRLE